MPVPLQFLSQICNAPQNILMKYLSCTRVIFVLDDMLFEYSCKHPWVLSIKTKTLRWNGNTVSKIYSLDDIHHNVPKQLNNKCTHICQRWITEFPEYQPVLYHFKIVFRFWGYMFRSTSSIPGDESCHCIKERLFSFQTKLYLVCDSNESVLKLFMYSHMLFRCRPTLLTRYFVKWLIKTLNKRQQIIHFSIIIQSRLLQLIFKKTLIYHHAKYDRSWFINAQNQ